MPKLQTLIGLEISKMFYKKRILFGLSFLIFIFIIMTYGMLTQSTYHHYDSPFYKEMLQDEIDYLTRELDSTDLTDKECEFIQQQIEDLEYELKVGYEKAREVKLYREKETLETLLVNDIDEEERKVLQLDYDIILAKIEHGEHSKEVRRLETEASIIYLENKLEEQLSPYDRLRTEMTLAEFNLDLQKTQLPSEHNAFSLLIMYFLSTAGFLFPLIIILVASEAISGEYSIGTIKLLLIKPFSRSKLFLSKYIALLFYGIFIFIFMGIIGFIIGGVFAGFEGATLTRIIGQQRVSTEFGYVIDYSTAYLVTNLQYLFIIFGLYIVTISVIIAFSMLISVFTKSATVSLVSTMGLIFIGSIISSIFYQSNWVKFLPMSHFEIINHLEGNFWFHGVSLPFSIIILLFYNILFLLIALYSFKNKDII